MPYKQYKQTIYNKIDIHTDMKNIFKYLIVGLLILLNSNNYIKSQIPYDSEISILTCSSGEELYSLFGHTAIRVKNESQNIDYVFNYGTFNFNTPNFYLKFMRGQLDYILSVTTFERFIYEYKYDQRSVIEQKIDTDEKQRKQIIDALITNSLPENKAYRYHFFYDNCATRVRDIIDDNLDIEITFNQLPDSLKNFTYRDAIGIYLHNKDWTKFGLDLILGQPTDDKLDEQTIQFLPDFLLNQFETATVNDNTTIISETESLLQFSKTTQPNKIKPIQIMLLILIIIVAATYYEQKQKKELKIINFLLLLPPVIISFLIIFLWFFTSHSVTGPNWHILWANPFLIIYLIPSIQKYKTGRYIMVILFLLILTLPITNIFIKQEISYILLPYWLSMAIRMSPITYKKIKNS